MGFTQIPGVDFTDSFVPVMSDVIMGVLIILCPIFGFHAKLANVEGDFLCSSLETCLHGSS